MIHHHLHRKNEACTSRCHDEGEGLCKMGLGEPTARYGNRKTIPTEAEHGTVTRYHAGCSCFECCAANTAYHREYRARKRAGEVMHRRGRKPVQSEDANALQRRDAVPPAVGHASPGGLRALPPLQEGEEARGGSSVHVRDDEGRVA